MEKICPNCGKHFEASPSRYPERIYCSPRCGALYRDREKRKRNKEILAATRIVGIFVRQRKKKASPPKVQKSVCEYCGAEFYPIRRGQRFCKSLCERKFAILQSGDNPEEYEYY